MRNIEKKWLVLLTCCALIAGCQGNVNQGTSSHVTVGREQATPSTAPTPPVANQTQRPTSTTPAAQRPPVAATPTQPSPSPQSTSAPPQPTPAPPPVAQPTPRNDPAPITQVVVQPAHPEAGVPLGDHVNVEVITLPQQETPISAPPPTPRRTTPPTSSTPPRTHASTESLTAQPHWLSRYPHLAEDLQAHEQTIQALEQELRQYQQRLNELQQQVRQHWGQQGVVANQAHQFVKYGDGFQSRGQMDFEQGRVIVETLDTRQPRVRLKEAILTTLLTPFDAENPEIYTDRAIHYSGPALLAGQILDHEGIPVRWEWRANRYADYLVENAMQQIQRDGRTIYRVEIPLIANHTQVRGQQYENLVRQASQRYQIDETLIYAIMETESHFNPYATSHIPAYGLMQIVPSTAGRDVFQRIKQRNDQPTRAYLFNPANNIDMGAAYLSILRDVYLKDITHPRSREYAMISGYNGGAGNVLRTFHSDRRQAVQVINQLTPEQVYQRLHQRHPAAEARGYIRKVTEAQQRYRNLATGRALNQPGDLAHPPILQLNALDHL